MAATATAASTSAAKSLSRDDAERIGQAFHIEPRLKVRRFRFGFYLLAPLGVDDLSM